MFVGHALLAFALAVLLADWRGWPARRALTVGIVAGAFAAIPDVDVVYALVAIDLTGLTADALTRPETLWNATEGVHRSVTHSLVLTLLAGPTFGYLAAGPSDSTMARAGRIVALTVLAALVAAATLTSGALGGIVTGAFVVAGLGVATLCRRWTDLSVGVVVLAATGGLFLHPWGDLVTGEPPALLYPLVTEPLHGRVVLHADPTVHLLGAFAIELGTIWLAAIALSRVLDVSWVRAIDRRAAVGVAYGVAAVAMTPPTLEVSYHFVFSILSVGVLCGGIVSRPLSFVTPGRFPTGSVGTEDAFRFAVTTLAAITAALASYAIVYVLATAIAG